MSSGYQQVPEFITQRILGCATNTFYVGKSRDYSRADIASGTLLHLGITWDDAGIHIPAEPMIPPSDRGRWSKRNIDGWIKVRKDLDRVEKVIGGWSTPNFGD